MTQERVPTLGEIIKKALIDSNLNQSAVAKKMGVTKQVINQIDRRKNFDIEFLTKLKEVTNLDFTKYMPKNAFAAVDPTPAIVSSGTIEMALTIKVKGDTDQLQSMGELMGILRLEAAKIGFQII